MEPWNDPNILAPPTSTTQHSNLNDLQDLPHACKSAIKVLSKQSPLHRESAILSRFIYKFDRKFRNDMGYKFLKKTNTALRRYLALNILKDIQNFLDVIPQSTEDKYFPTRQMLEYVIIRIISFSKIMMRICVCSKQASVYYMNRIKRGESHWMSLMPYALVSRIWTFSKVLLQHSCTWYSRMYPFLQQLTLKGLDFLPVGFSFPENLEKWLDFKNLDNYGRFEWSHKKCMEMNLNFIEDDEISFDTILNYVKDINSQDSQDNQTSPMSSISPKVSTISIQVQHIPLEKDVDRGISISREHFKSFFSNENTKENENNNHSADNVTNKVTLERFIDQEDKYRNEENNLSLTKHLSFMQWQTLKTSLLHLSNLLSNNRKIERKFKKIWKEKCLDYIN